MTRPSPAAQEVERVAKACRATYCPNIVQIRPWREALPSIRAEWRSVARAAIRALAARTGKGRK